MWRSRSPPAPGAAQACLPVHVHLAPRTGRTVALFAGACWRRVGAVQLHLDRPIGALWDRVVLRDHGRSTRWRRRCRPVSAARAAKPERLAHWRQCKEDAEPLKRCRAAVRRAGAVRSGAQHDVETGRSCPIADVPASATACAPCGEPSFSPACERMYPRCRTGTVPSRHAGLSRACCAAAAPRPSRVDAALARRSSRRIVRAAVLRLPAPSRACPGRREASAACRAALAVAICRPPRSRIGRSARLEPEAAARHLKVRALWPGRAGRQQPLFPAETVARSPISRASWPTRPRRTFTAASSRTARPAQSDDRDPRISHRIAYQKVGDARTVLRGGAAFG